MTTALCRSAPLSRPARGKAPGRPNSPNCDFLLEHDSAELPMKDLYLSRMINVVAAGSILVTAAGCGSQYKRAAKKWCKTFKECNEDEFDVSWDSVKECAEEYVEYLESAEDTSESCGVAMADLLECGAEEYGKSCEPYSDYYGCIDEFVEFYEECYAAFGYE